ncbi:hypothetical protein PPL_07687 [Heterostelium album PN500]|uniref:Ankyrin repeat protein n=1 Tax=Heterostelium pallidum (strain ATCC 26659 / Pp 5 / PN500) TaxID=670386 RepID=D3BGN5_HETP5|nr:hypothetical protein PPL_07687 [Heterostelium album PN500]EFA79269.1 hypothetical protein PPL_07687 [Heterostelium album PN500]|eukprot:XP_020431390.1 hypothetical protein PPL_07687 [Heterostelium album PN500]
MDKQLFLSLFDNFVIHKKIFKNVKHSVFNGSYNYLDMFKKYFIDREAKGDCFGFDNYSQSKIYECAIIGGSLELFQYSLEQLGLDREKTFRSNKCEPNMLMCLVSKYGRSDILHYIFGLDELQQYSWDYYSMMVNAPLSGNFELLKFLVGKVGSTPNNKDSFVNTAIDNAAREGPLDMLQYLEVDRAMDLERDSSNLLLYNAITGGNIEVIEYVLNKYLDDLNSDGEYYDLIDMAAYINRLDIIKLVSQRIGINQCSSEAMWSAIRHHNLEMLSWLHENTEGGCEDCLDSAGSQGTVEIVKWLNQNCTSECTSAAMTDAARAGKLDIVIWLHNNRSEGCDSDTLDRAIANQNLEVVKWLLANRSECTLASIDSYCRTEQEWLNLNLEQLNLFTN